VHGKVPSTYTKKRNITQPGTEVAIRDSTRATETSIMDDKTDKTADKSTLNSTDPRLFSLIIKARASSISTTLSITVNEFRQTFRPHIPTCYIGFTIISEIVFNSVSSNICTVIEITIVRKENTAYRNSPKVCYHPYLNFLRLRLYKK
jgi:hypothetical protein